MMINKSIVSELRQIVDENDFKRLKKTAQEAHRIEKKYEAEMDKIFAKAEEKIAKALEGGKKFPKDIDFEEIIMEHAFHTAKAGFVTAETENPKREKRDLKRLAKKKAKARHSIKKGQLPRSLSGLMNMWDKWKKKEIKTPSRQAILAKELKKKYLEKTQGAFEKYSRDFRSGKSSDKASIIKKIKDRSRATFARAKTILETETTKYYNQARRDYYDGSDDVTHYLFVPIRDMATTKWCKSRRLLVYKKGSKHLDNETPPIHWNCRSELLPLTPLNPKHKKLIDDKSRRRENRRPAPLPPGWNG